MVEISRVKNSQTAQMNVIVLEEVRGCRDIATFGLEENYDFIRPLTSLPIRMYMYGVTQCFSALGSKPINTLIEVSKRSLLSLPRITGSVTLSRKIDRGKKLAFSMT